MSLPKSLLLKHSFMYAKRGGVAAYLIVWIGLCLRSVPGVRVLASAKQIKHIMMTNRQNTLHKRYQHNMNELKKMLKNNNLTITKADKSKAIVIM